MELFIGIVVGLLILVVLVIFHELGHAIAARRNGVVVEEFGIGFPPRIWKKKLRNGTVFSLNWIPLGGFVKLQGEYDSAKGKGDYGSVGFYKKTKILLAGVMTNWIMAGILLSVLALSGMPKILPNQFTVAGDIRLVNQPVEITEVKKDYPAAKARLTTGDKILRFAGHEVPTPARLIEISKQNRGKTVEVVYDRAGKERTVRVALRNEPKMVFGAGLNQPQLIRSTWSAPIVGFGTTVQFTYLTIQSVGEMAVNFFGGLISQLSPDSVVRQNAADSINTVSNSVAGPIGILGVIFPAAQQAGPTQLIFLTAIISLSLAVMNALPIPSLDGGRWFTMAIFKLLNKKLTKEREEKIQLVGFSILMSLILLVTIADVAKLF